SCPTAIVSFVIFWRVNSCGGRNVTAQFTTVPSGFFTFTYSVVCGLYHSILETVPFSVTTLLVSQISARLGCAENGAANSIAEKRTPRTNVMMPPAGNYT